jgi:hypothetical protein
MQEITVPKFYECWQGQKFKTSKKSENLKGVSSKPFGKLICSCPDFLFLELETSNFGYFIISLFHLTVQICSKIGQH